MCTIIDQIGKLNDLIKKKKNHVKTKSITCRLATSFFFFCAPNSFMYVRRNVQHRSTYLYNLCKSIELHELWCKPQQPVQSMQRELPRKQIAYIRSLPIILTLPTVP